MNKKRAAASATLARPKSWAKAGLIILTDHGNDFEPDDTIAFGAGAGMGATKPSIVVDTTDENGTITSYHISVRGPVNPADTNPVEQTGTSGAGTGALARITWIPAAPP